MSYFTKYVCFYKLDEKNTLLLNTITSAMDIVDNHTYGKIQQMIQSGDNITSDSDELLYKKLKSRGYIFENVKEEKEQIDKLVSISKRIADTKIPYRFVICPTMGCNLRCTYCFESEEQHERFNLLSDSQLNVIFNYIQECYVQYAKQHNFTQLSNKRKQPFISLFGGEPLLKCNFHIVEKVLDFAHQIKMPVAIVTNATTIDSDYCALLKTHKDDIMAIQITMDGNKSVHDKRRIRADGSGTFESICNGVNTILDIGIKVNLRINVDAENINNLGELKQVFEKQGWLHNPLFFPYASPVKCYDHSKKSCNIMTESDMLDILIKNNWYGTENSFLSTLLAPVYSITTNFFTIPGDHIKPWKQTYCEGTSGSQYCFTPDGNISTCLTCVGNPKYRIGTFDETGVKIDKHRLDMWTRRNCFETPKCRTCKFVFLCGGGCPVESLENNNDINCPECDDIKRTLEVFVEHSRNKLLEAVK